VRSSRGPAHTDHSIPDHVDDDGWVHQRAVLPATVSVGEELPTIRSDADLARSLATRAGRVLLNVRESWTATAETATLREAGDRAAQRFLAGQLTVARPTDAMLSEEAADDPSRLSADRVWIVDPLDGTREFAEGRSDWAVHVALWHGGVLTAGALALPARDTTLSSAEPWVAPAPAVGAPRIAVSRTRAPELVHRMAASLGASLVPMGSAGYKIAAVLRGAADAYVHAGGQYEWDSAAPVAVARAAGLHASRIDGSPLRYNQPDPYLPDLIVCRPELADLLLGQISQDLSFGPVR
jgi:3'(2'), 5'-bisphosphate nucleotidase